MFLTFPITLGGCQSPWLYSEPSLSTTVARSNKPLQPPIQPRCWGFGDDDDYYYYSDINIDTCFSCFWNYKDGFICLAKIADMYIHTLDLSFLVSVSFVLQTFLSPFLRFTRPHGPGTRPTGLPSDAGTCARGTLGHVGGVGDVLWM